MLAAEQEQRAHAQHEDRAGHVAGAHRVDEFGLRHRVEQHRGEVGDFHAQRIGVERCPDGVLHPAVGDQDPECREVGAERRQPGDGEVSDPGQAIPAEEEQPDERRLEEERHQALDGERGAEDVAYVLAVVAPAHAELEFHHDAGSDAHGEVDAEQRAPEQRRAPPHVAAGHDVDALHDGEQERQPESQRYEQEMVERRGCKLQSRQVHDERISHDSPSLVVILYEAVVRCRLPGLDPRQRHGTRKPPIAAR